MKTIKNEMTRIKRTITAPMITLVLLFGFITNVNANKPTEDDFNQTLIALQHQWVDVNYAKNKKLKKTAFLALQEKSTELTSAFPNRAEAWIWHGIIQSSFAGFKGGLGAISLVDDAKGALEKALVINENE